MLLKIFPESVDVDLNKLIKSIKDKLPEEYQLISHKEEPIAFGLKALNVLISMPEIKEGGTYELEQIISKIEGVSEVEVLRVTRSFV